MAKIVTYNANSHETKAHRITEFYSVVYTVCNLINDSIT